MDPVTLSLGAKALGILKRFWYVVPILAMAAYCAVLTDRVGDRDATIKAQDTEIVQLEGRNGVTQASLDGALFRIDALNLDAEARAKRFQSDLALARADEARMAERYRSTASTVSRLEASARDEALDPCRVSDAAREALKEL